MADASYLCLIFGCLIFFDCADTDFIECPDHLKVVAPRRGMAHKAILPT